MFWGLDVGLGKLSIMFSDDRSYFAYRNPERDDIAIYKGKFIQLPWGDDKKSFGMDHILHNAIRQANRRWEQVTDKDDENAILGIIDILNAKDLKVFKESPLSNKIIIRSAKFKRARRKT